MGIFRRLFVNSPEDTKANLARIQAERELHHAKVEIELWRNRYELLRDISEQNSRDIHEARKALWGVLIAIDLDPSKYQPNSVTTEELGTFVLLQVAEYVDSHRLDG